MRLAAMAAAAALCLVGQAAAEGRAPVWNDEGRATPAVRPQIADLNRAPRSESPVPSEWRGREMRKLNAVTDECRRVTLHFAPEPSSWAGGYFGIRWRLFLRSDGRACPQPIDEIKISTRSFAWTSRPQSLTGVVPRGALILTRRGPDPLATGDVASCEVREVQFKSWKRL